MGFLAIEKNATKPDSNRNWNDSFRDFLLKYFPSLHSIKNHGIIILLCDETRFKIREYVSSWRFQCDIKATHLVRSMSRFYVISAKIGVTYIFWVFCLRKVQETLKKVNLSFYAPSYDRKELCDPLLSQKSPICLPGERFGFTCCPA